MTHHISIYICLYTFLMALTVVVGIGLWHGLYELKKTLYDSGMTVPERYTAMWFAFSIFAFVLDIFIRKDLSVFTMTGLVMTTMWQTRGYRPSGRTVRHPRGVPTTGQGGGRR